MTNTTQQVTSQMTGHVTPYHTYAHTQTSRCRHIPIYMCTIHANTRLWPQNVDSEYFQIAMYHIFSEAVNIAKTSITATTPTPKNVLISCVCPRSYSKNPNAFRFYICHLLDISLVHVEWYLKFSSGEDEIVSFIAYCYRKNCLIMQIFDYMIASNLG